MDCAPNELIGNRPRIILNGRKEMTVQQHCGLFSYETRLIRIRTAEGILGVRGKDLVISFFGVQDMQIRGMIESLQMDGDME